jgi:HEPN domain-containing protein
MPRDEACLQEAREWLDRAERDLQAAKNELEADSALPEMTAYHSQQAGEKALKAFLTAHAISFPFTHDLVPLVGLCESVDISFREHMTAAQKLSPYATQFRYPGGPLSPSKEEAEEAVRLAEAIVRLVRSRLSV